MTLTKFTDAEGKPCDTCYRKFDVTAVSLLLLLTICCARLGAHHITSFTIMPKNTFGLT